MELDTINKIRDAWYRLAGIDADDEALTKNGEAATEVVDLSLTRGSRVAQRWMIKMGYAGWRRRSSALVWSGTDDTTGGRYSALPTDFLRAYGDERTSALQEANGDRWGQEVNARDAAIRGSGYYFQGEQLWLTRLAQVPSTLYLDYHYKHPLWSDSVTIDFPMDARGLIVAEGVDFAKTENWLLGGPEMEQKIREARSKAQQEARDISRPSKQPRTIRKPLRIGNHW